MKVDDALKGVTHLFVDTAPVIYFVEKNPTYSALVKGIFDQVDAGVLMAVVSPVTLAECLVIPYRAGQKRLQQDFLDLLVRGQNTIFAPIDHVAGQRAAEMRARHNLDLLDAMQVAVALGNSCEALLTNDTRLRRVSELRVLVLDELEL